MKCKYTDCLIKKKIDGIREVLESFVFSGEELQAGKVLKLSQTLDKLIVRCLKCNMTYTSSGNLDISDTLGKHSMFFYYGREHLFVNLAAYVKKSVENNEKCYLFIYPEWFAEFMEYLKKRMISTDNVEYFLVKEMIELLKSQGAGKLKEYVATVAEETTKSGFNGIRMIGQTAYAIELYSKADFLHFETVLSEAYAGSKASALCLYDFDDYIHTSKYMSDDVIEEAFETHSHVMRVPAVGD